MNHLKTFLAAGALALASGAASAASYYNGQTCTEMDVTIGGGTYGGCYGVLEKEGPGGINDQNVDLNGDKFYNISLSAWMGGDPATSTIGLFGGGWTFAAKAGIGGSDGGLSVGDGTFSWTGAVYDQMLVILKQANTFAAYLFNDGISGGGFWSTADWPQGAGGLSHISVYYKGDPINEIPLPAAGFLLVGGLGGLALVRRRKA